VIHRAALLLLLVTASCDMDTAERQVISREDFIRVNVELRQIQHVAEDADEQRREILERHGLTQEQVLDFVENGGHSIEELREIWTEITRRLEEAQVRPDTGGGGQSI
jgi:hypothetical protein